MSRTGPLSAIIASVPLVLGALPGVGFAFPGASDVEVIKIKFDKNCGSNLTLGTKKLEGSDSEVLVWRVSSKCSEPLTITIKTSHAPIKCVGQPEKANVDVEFTVNSGEKASIACAVDYAKPGRHLISVDVKGQYGEKGGELALEVEP